MAQRQTNVFLLAAAIGAARFAQIASAQSSETINSADWTDVQHTTHWLVDTIEYFFDEALPTSLVWLTIFFFFLFLAYLVPRLCASVCLRCVAARHWVLFWQHLFTIAIITYGLWLAFAAIGVDAANLALTFGIIGLALSQGASAVIGNAISALAMQLDAELSVGYTLDVGGIRGRIVSMDLRQITLIPDDGEGGRIYVPNEILSRTIHRVYAPRVAKRSSSAGAKAKSGDGESVSEKMLRVGVQSKLNYEF